jgi:hypothetical protein
VSPRKAPAGGATAAELLACLKDDQAYQGRSRAADEARRVRTEELRHAERPIVADLRDVGVAVESVWDLVNTSIPYSHALPVLLMHLERGGYPDRVMESLGRALAVRPASFAWDRLERLYRTASGSGETEGLAVALAASATADHVDRLVDILDEAGLGETRIHLLRAIKRVGGTKGRQVLESLREDQTFGREANAVLR